MTVRKHRALWRTAATAVALGSLLAPTLLASPASADSDDEFKVLVFSKTTGFRHDSIPDGIAAIQKLGQDNNFSVDATEDSAKFTDENLAQYQAVIWLSTTGDPLNTQEQRDAFERYIKQGGGYAGIHAASDTHYSWAWYGKLVGAYFKSHPAIQNATVKVEDLAHPSTKHLPSSWTRNDEWYDYRANPRGTVHVLASMDEKSYSGATMGIDHPTVWCQDFDGGRSWYTGLGHTKQSFTEPNFLKMLLGGIKTAAGVEKADCAASQSGSFEKIALDNSTKNPMMLDVATDGRVFYIDRMGEVKIVKPSGASVSAGKLNVFTANESGLLGLALDRNFDSNHWLYLFYSPAGSENVDRLSRFTVTGDTLDMSSEKKVLDVPVQRAECCHHGGGMLMDPKTGDLWLATGDNTNPFASDGYSPIDERPGRGAWDAQRTSGNTNDLSGKLLRIHPEADGTYTVPEGNLFAPGTEKTKAEIYAMGFRNPFRIGLDPKTGYPMVADYGPDAGSANATRGPENTVEWNLVTKPGNYGWPYCTGPNRAYIDFDFGTRQSGSAFDCAALVNDSPNNTGLTNLPPAVPATVWYHYSTDPNNFPELNGGAPMAGPVYRYDEDLKSDVKWPAYWDGKAIFGEWNNNKVFSFQLNEDTTKLVKINQILKSMSFKRPMDIKFGPDGALYLIEWGSGFGGDNADSGVYRIEYIKGNRPPVAKAAADKTDGPLPLTVQFSSAGTRDPNGKALTYAWDFGDGTDGSAEANPTHTYTKGGEFNAVLTVTNADGRTATASVTINAGNTQPSVTVDLPPNGGFFDFGDLVKVKVTVTDPEDGQIDCDEVQIQAILGHDGHGHPLDQLKGCEGVVRTSEGGHGAYENLFYVIEASYTDKGAAGGAKPLTGRGQVILQPKRKEAEHFSAHGRVADGKGTDAAGVQTETTSDPQGGGLNVGYVQDGDWFSFDPVNLSNIDAIRFRAASATSGGTIQVKMGNPETGKLIGTLNMAGTGGWQSWVNVTMNLTDPPTETGPIYFIVRKPASVGNGTFLINFNWIDFVGKGFTLDDKTAPVTTAKTDPAQPAGGWFTGPVSVTLTAADEADGSGVERTEYQLDGGDWTPYTGSVTVSGDGSHTLAYRSVDKAGNVEDAKTLTVKVDATAPMTTAQFAPANSDGWHGGAVPVTLTATDATSGVAKTEYSLDGGDWTAYTGPVTITGDGKHELRYRSTDNAGNVEAIKAATLEIDTKSPTVLVSGVAAGEQYGDSQDLQISWQALDNGSGLASVSGTLDGKPFESGTVVALHELALGEHTLTVTAVNKAGNRTEQTVKFAVVTSTADIAGLIDRFASSGKLTALGAHKLHRRLDGVIDAETKDKSNEKSIDELEKFKAFVNDEKVVSDDQVRATLIRDADALIVQYGGTPTG